MSVYVAQPHWTKSLFAPAYTTHDGQSLAVCAACVCVFLSISVPQTLQLSSLLLMDLQQNLDQGASPNQD